MANKKSGIIDLITGNGDSRNAKFHKIEKPSNADHQQTKRVEEYRAGLSNSKRQEWTPVSQVVKEEDAEERKSTAGKTNKGRKKKNSKSPLLKKKKSGSRTGKDKKGRTKKQKKYTPEQIRRKKKRQRKLQLLIQLFDEIGAALIEVLDRFLDKVDEAAHMLWHGIERAAAGIIIFLDIVLDTIFWAIGKFVIMIVRKVHDLRMLLDRYHHQVVQIFSIALIAGTAMVALYASQIDYQYSYNGRVLGIVHEQRDVLEILDLVSEELSIEYGSSIVIDPETDVTFERVISHGKEIDDVDTVLKRFTYMGDLQVQAYGIWFENKRLAVVESESVANAALQEVLNMYMKDDDAEYLSVGFAEAVKVEEFSTKLANVGSRSQAVKALSAHKQEESVYKVVSGDTLIGIADKLDTTIKELKDLNPELKKSDLLHIGQKIVTQEEVPLLTIRTEEISTFAEAVDYDTVTKKSDAYYEGDKVVVRAGQKGKQRVTARLVRENGEIVEREDLEVEIIKEPVDKIVYKGTKKVPPKKGTGTFQRPVNVGVYRGYGMRWGRMHYGLDYAASTGTAIHAADGGTVIAAGWSGAYGYRITIDHGGGFTTLYGHCSRMYVSVGEKVFKGQTIAAVGSTGRSTGPHCHFEIKKNGVNVNPANYV